MRRVVAHIDLDAFFAACEILRNPSLKDKAVVIGGSGNPMTRGVVSTANYAARKFGIHSAQPLVTAYRLNPDAVFLPVDIDYYMSVSARVKAIFRDVCPVVESGGIDEAYLELTGMAARPEDLAMKIKNRVRAETGLTCSVGLAACKLVAKVASDLMKPDGLTVVWPEDVPNKIWPLAVRKLHGVGPKTEEALKALAIMTIGDLAASPPDLLVEHFGRSYGNYLHEASHGNDESPLVTHWEAKSTSRETTFEHDIGNIQTIRKYLAGLVAEVVQDIAQRACLCRNVAVKVRLSDFTTKTKAMTLDKHTDSESDILSTALLLLDKFELGAGKLVRLIGLRVSMFCGKDDAETAGSQSQRRRMPHQCSLLDCLDPVGGQQRLAERSDP